MLHKKGTREDIENNMPEFLQRTMKKESKCNPKKVQLFTDKTSRILVKSNTCVVCFLALGVL